MNLNPIDFSELHKKSSIPSENLRTQTEWGSVWSGYVLASSEVARGCLVRFSSGVFLQLEPLEWWKCISRFMQYLPLDISRAPFQISTFRPQDFHFLFSFRNLCGLNKLGLSQIVLHKIDKSKILEGSHFITFAFAANFTIILSCMKRFVQVWHICYRFYIHKHTICIYILYTCVICIYVIMGT